MFQNVLPKQKNEVMTSLQLGICCPLSESSDWSLTSYIKSKNSSPQCSHHMFFSSPQQTPSSDICPMPLSFLRKNSGDMVGLGGRRTLIYPTKYAILYKQLYLSELLFPHLGNEDTAEISLDVVPCSLGDQLCHWWKASDLVICSDHWSAESVQEDTCDLPVSRVYWMFPHLQLYSVCAEPGVFPYTKEPTAQPSTSVLTWECSKESEKSATLPIPEWNGDLLWLQYWLACFREVCHLQAGGLTSGWWHNAEFLLGGSGGQGEGGWCSSPTRQTEIPHSPLLLSCFPLVRSELIPDVHFCFTKSAKQNIHLFQKCPTIKSV